MSENNTTLGMVFNLHTLIRNRSGYTDKLSISIPQCAMILDELLSDEGFDFDYGISLSKLDGYYPIKKSLLE